MDLCPLHQDHHPTFVVDPSKGLFYRYGCGRGGDVIRFAEIHHEVRFPQAVVLLRQWRGLAPSLQDAANFYRLQLHRHGAAVAYLDQRGIRSPEVIASERMRNKRAARSRHEVFPVAGWHRLGPCRERPKRERV